jgi:hypothetical protein
VVFLHGGPGAGCSPEHRRLFDPARYRIVLLDQRNCGRSIPSASDHATDLSANTTWNLVADLELMRAQLGIERWQTHADRWLSVPTDKGANAGLKVESIVAGMVAGHARTSRNMPTGGAVYGSDSPWALVSRESANGSSGDINIRM